MDDVYEMLSALKGKSESFSDEIRRLVKIKGGIMELAGSWNDISEEDAIKFKSRLNERRNSRTRLDENIGRYN